MKITASLLQTISVALVIPCFTVSCTGKQDDIAQRSRVHTRDTTHHPGQVRIADTLKTDSLILDDSGFYCPPCGRG